MNISIVDLNAVREGITMPDKDPAIEELHEFVSALSPKLISLKWVVRNRPEAFAPALFTFGLRHRASVEASASLLPPEGWGLAMLIPPADRLRTRFGADWNSLEHNDTWPKILYHAVDHAVDALWYLRAGMTVPAALIARTLLERWTLNVAHWFEIERSDEEDDEAFISRVWRSYRHPSMPRDVGAWWAWLSELLHGRPGTGVFGGECAISLTSNIGASVPLHAAISRILELSVRQVRGGLSTLAESEGLTDAIPAFQSAPPDGSSVLEPFPLTHAFLPLEYYEAYRNRSEQWVQLAALYRKNVTDDSWELTTRPNAVMTIEALFERRGRAVERARYAFENEKTALGDDFNPGLLASKMFRLVSIAQMARLLAASSGGHERAAFSTAAQAVDGAARLWLEDSDYSMGCVRVLLEQTARLRVHRLKSARAARLEARPRASASRWLSDAGWGRLAVLMRAVNEFSHLGLRTRRRGAREVLSVLQLDGPELETARGSALLSVVYMFAFEMHARLGDEPDMAALFADSVMLLDEAEHMAVLEAYLRNAHEWRHKTFGEPDLVSPQEHAEHEQE